MIFDGDDHPPNADLAIGENMKLQLVATCLFGLEHLLGEEIDALGYERISTINGRVTFLGDEEAVALANVF